MTASQLPVWVDGVKMTQQEAAELVSPGNATVSEHLLNIATDHNPRDWYTIGKHLNITNYPPPKEPQMIYTTIKSVDEFVSLREAGTEIEIWFEHPLGWKPWILAIACNDLDTALTLIRNKRLRYVHSN